MLFALLLCVKILLQPATATPLLPDTNATTTEDLDAKPSYEITENVLDVPDNRPKLPIIANYSIQKPLNIAKPVETGEKSNKFSFLQIQSESDVPQDFTEFSDKDSNIFNDIKNAFKGLKKSILTGIHSWLSKKIEENSA